MRLQTVRLVRSSATPSMALWGVSNSPMISSGNRRLRLGVDYTSILPRHPFLQRIKSSTEAKDEMDRDEMDY